MPESFPSLTAILGIYSALVTVLIGYLHIRLNRLEDSIQKAANEGQHRSQRIVALETYISQLLNQDKAISDWLIRVESKLDRAVEHK